MSNLPVDPRTLAAEFWKDMGAEDFSTPRISLAQWTSKESSSAGKFVSNTGNVFDFLPSCKLIVPTKTRVLFSGDNRSRCASDNFYSPASRIKDPVSANCLTCAVGQWGESPLKDQLAKETKPKNYNPNKPLCNETYQLLIADRDWNLFFIKFQKTQLKVVSEGLFTRIRHSFNSVAPYEVQFDINPVEVGTYFNVSFDNFKIVDEAERGKGAELYLGWSKKASDVLAKQHEEMDLAHDEPPF